MAIRAPDGAKNVYLSDSLVGKNIIGVGRLLDPMELELPQLAIIFMVAVISFTMETMIIAITKMTLKKKTCFIKHPQSLIHHQLNAIDNPPRQDDPQ